MLSQIANILRGKHKPSFTPNSDCGDNVIVHQRRQAARNGQENDREGLHHALGLSRRPEASHRARADGPRSRRVIEHAVKGMLQGNKLGSAQFRNLYVYAGTEHPHEAQQPVAIELKNL